MAKHKKTKTESTGTEQPMTTEESTKPFELVEVKPPEALTFPKTPAPLFTDDKSELYRDLLLERPGVPVITNIQEALSFVGAYQKWNNKVKIAFR